LPQTSIFVFRGKVSASVSQVTMQMKIKQMIPNNSSPQLIGKSKNLSAIRYNERRSFYQFLFDQKKIWRLKQKKIYKWKNIIQWAPLNGITDNRINRIMGSI